MVITESSCPRHDLIAPGLAAHQGFDDGHSRDEAILPRFPPFCSTIWSWALPHALLLASVDGTSPAIRAQFVILGGDGVEGLPESVCSISLKRATCCRLRLTMDTWGIITHTTHKPHTTWLQLETPSFPLPCALLRFSSFCCASSVHTGMVAPSGAAWTRRSCICANL